MNWFLQYIAHSYRKFNGTKVIQPGSKCIKLTSILFTPQLTVLPLFNSVNLVQIYEFQQVNFFQILKPWQR